MFGNRVPKKLNVLYEHRCLGSVGEQNIDEDGISVASLNVVGARNLKARVLCSLTEYYKPKERPRSSDYYCECCCSRGCSVDDLNPRYCLRDHEVASAEKRTMCRESSLVPVSEAEPVTLPHDAVPVVDASYDLGCVCDARKSMRPVARFAHRVGDAPRSRQLSLCGRRFYHLADVGLCPPLPDNDAGHLSHVTCREC